MADVGDWEDDCIRDIYLAQGLSAEPMALKVRRFRPRSGDDCYRRWRTGEVAVEPYCLADIQATANYFVQYLSRTSCDGLKKTAKKSCKLVRETYNMAVDHARFLEVCRALIHDLSVLTLASTAKS